MTLGELISALKKADQNKVCRVGFKAPHSYRGFYEQLAFEPAPNRKVSEMLSDAQEALGKTYQGYKGGDYEMKEYTDVWLASYGCSGEMLTKLSLAYMLSGEGPPKVPCTNCNGTGEVDYA